MLILCAAFFCFPSQDGRKQTLIVQFQTLGCMSSLNPCDGAYLQTTAGGCWSKPFNHVVLGNRVLKSGHCLPLLAQPDYNQITTSHVQHKDVSRGNQENVLEGNVNGGAVIWVQCNITPHTKIASNNS